MADNAFRCRLVTPASSLIDEDVTYANVPAWDGLMGFSPGRAPIVARLGLGQLTLRPSEKTLHTGEKRFLVEGGFVQMSESELIILAEHATPAEDLDETQAQKDLTEAEQATVPDDAADPAAATDRLNQRKARARLALRMARAK